MANIYKKTQTDKKYLKKLIENRKISKIVRKYKKSETHRLVEFRSLKSHRGVLVEALPYCCSWRASTVSVAREARALICAKCASPRWHSVRARAAMVWAMVLLRLAVGAEAFQLL